MLYEEGTADFKWNIQVWNALLLGPWHCKNWPLSMMKIGGVMILTHIPSLLLCISCNSQAIYKLMRELRYESQCAYLQKLHLFPLAHHRIRVPLWNVLTINCWYSEQSKAFSTVTTKTETHMAACTHFAICIRKLLISHWWSPLRWELMLTSAFGS